MLIQPKGNAHSIEFFQYFEENTRVQKSLTGYTLRIQCNAILKHLSISGLLVALGLFYTATLMAEGFLVNMLLPSSDILKQQQCDLDLARHMKEKDT